MSNINIEISNNVVVVSIDNKYCGTSVIPKEYNDEPVSVFVGLRYRVLHDTYRPFAVHLAHSSLT